MLLSLAVGELIVGRNVVLIFQEPCCALDNPLQVLCAILEWVARGVLYDVGLRETEVVGFSVLARLNAQLAVV